MSLVFHKFWPKKIRRFMPIYWYIGILYCLPFFFTIFLLKNNSTGIPELSMMMAIILLILLIDWMSVMVLFGLGGALGAIFYFLTTTGPHISIAIIPDFIFYIFVVIAGTIFNYKTRDLIYYAFCIGKELGFAEYLKNQDANIKLQTKCEKNIIIKLADFKKTK